MNSTGVFTYKESSRYTFGDQVGMREDEEHRERKSSTTQYHYSGKI